MTVKTIDEHIKKAFSDLGFKDDEIKKGCWLLERNEKPIAWICLHKFLERVAQVAGITFDEPKVLNLEPNEIAMYVNGHKGDFSAWAIGEASSKNCKNDYRWAMAEKRAKDRVILKLLGVAGDVYSEEEADDFKKAPDDTEFKAEAKNWKTANTKAVRQAVATGAEFTPAEPKKPLEERYQRAYGWLCQQTPESYSHAPKSHIDYIRNMATELRGNDTLLEPFMTELTRVNSIDDNINF